MKERERELPSCRFLPNRETLCLTRAANLQKILRSEEEETDTDAKTQQTHRTENKQKTNRKQTENKQKTNRKQTENKQKTNRKQTENKQKTNRRTEGKASEEVGGQWM